MGQLKKRNFITKGLRTWIEIDKKALKKNYLIFRKLIKKNCRMMAVVKSNAYGHSLLDFSREMQKLGIDWFGVDSIVEGIALQRKNIKKPILVLGHTLPEKIIEAVKHNISLTISNWGDLKNAIIIAKKLSRRVCLKIHLEIDTGMHRQGFFTNNLPQVARLLKKPGLKLRMEGVYTHFAAAKNPSFPQETLSQIKEFKKAMEILESAGFNFIKHTSATSGTLLFPQAHFDMVRIGIGLYGMWPSKETKAAFEDKIKIKPVLCWKTIISEIKDLPTGSRVGYDFTEAVLRKSRVAVLPIGYWHGYPRSLSSVGRVLIKEQKAKILGRISMDIIIVNITDIKNVQKGDEVILIGKEITADYLANLADTINYEITTRLNPLIKRIYL